MNEVLGMLLRRHRPDNEALSALLDGQLAGRKLDAVQAHVASCDVCRDRLEALRRTREALRALPQAEAPRSFRLRAADVAAPETRRRAPVAMRAMPVLGAAAALVFIAVLGTDLARGGGSATGGNEATGLQAMSARTRDAAPTAGGEDARSGSPGSPPAEAYDTAEAGAPRPPEPSGSPQPALAPAGEQGVPPDAPAPNSGVPAPAAPATQTVPPAASRSEATITIVQGGPSSAKAATATDSSSGGARDASSSSRGSGDRSDTAYRIAEAVAAAIALAAIAGSVAWRLRNRKVGP